VDGGTRLLQLDPDSDDGPIHRIRYQQAYKELDSGLRFGENATDSRNSDNANDIP